MEETTLAKTTMTSSHSDRSETIGKLAEALSKAQLEFKPIVRDKNNPFFKSKYAPLENVIAATAEALANNSLAITQQIGYHPVSLELCVITTIMHSSGEYCSGYIPLPKTAKPQELGSAITYYRRYALCAALNVSADDDDDGNSASSSSSSQKKTTDDDERPQRLKQTKSLYNRLVRTKGYTEPFTLTAESNMGEIVATYRNYKNLLEE